MRIKNMPREERPQEKLLYGGAAALSTAELLALVIRTGNQGRSAVQLAEEVIAYVSPASGGAGNAEVSELMEIEGIGISKACSIVATHELARRMRQRERVERTVVRGAADAASVLMEKLRGEKREHVVVLLLNVKCEIESEHIVSIGELSAAAIHPREIFCQAIRRSAAAIIVAHNHPSGDPAPSEEDIFATKRLQKAGELLGIRLLDHLVIGDGVYRSMKSDGLME